MLPKMLNGKELAAALHISKTLAYQLLSNGDLPSIRFGKKAVRVKEEDLLRWIEAHANNKSSPISTENK